MRFVSRVHPDPIPDRTYKAADWRMVNLMRTSLLDIIRLAVALWRHRHRRYLRIGQIIGNAYPGCDPYYVENAELTAGIRADSK